MRLYVPVKVASESFHLGLMNSPLSLPVLLILTPKPTD
jgi:hypothetical protein